jgi:hypothetical protein
MACEACKVSQMFTPKKEFFELYRFIPETDTFIFDIIIDTYEGLFNRLDPSPFKQRDLLPDLLDYLDQCSSDIPSKYSVALSVNLTEQKFDLAREREVTSGMRTNFRYMVNSISQQIASIYRKAARYVVVSFLGITSVALFNSYLPENIFFDFLKEGLLIGGWVFLWEAFSLVFIQMHDIRMNLKKFKRLLGSQIQFTYKNI